MTIPYLLQVAEGTNIELTAEKLIGNPILLKGTPWRLLRTTFTVSNTAFTSNDTPGYEPSCIQVDLNSASLSNIEGTMTARYLVSHFPKTYTLHMPAPNLWKEDEQKTQALIAFEHFKYGVTQFRNSIVYVLGSALIQFGRIPIDASKLMVSSQPARQLVSAPDTPTSQEGFEMM